MISELKETFKTLTRSLEVLYLMNDLKPAIRLDAYEEELRGIVGFCNKNNLKIKKSDFKVIKQTDKNKGSFSNKGILADITSPQKGVIYLYISKSEEKAEKAKLSESKHNDKEFGKTLGYPDCCVDFFVKNKPLQEKKQNDYILPALKGSTNFIFPFYNNYAARYFDITLLSHFPCSFNCKESIEIAKKNFKCIEKYSKEYADIMQETLKTAVLYTEYDGIFLLKNHKLNNNNLSFEKIISSANNDIYQLLKNNKKIEIKDKNNIIIGNKELKDVGLMVFV